jgi:hypothetical protein
LFVPGISDDAARPATDEDARHTFETLHIWLGEALGETLGYSLTAAFTVVLVALARTETARWLLASGCTSAPPAGR